MVTARLDGWEQRLRTVIEDARSRPYVLGEHDCFRLACNVVLALTGVDRWPKFAGYTTRREALAKLAQHGSTFEAAGDWFFGSDKRIKPTFAQRGDIVAIATSDGEKHLGICNGAYVLMMAPEGLIAHPLNRATVADGFYTAGWRVG